MSNILILNKSYPFKVWICTCICGPFLGIVFNVAYDPDIFETSMIYGPLLLGIMAMLISLPAFIVYYFLFRFLGLKLKSEFVLKVILSLFNCGAVILIFLISGLKTMMQPSNTDGFLFFQGTIIITLLAGFFFKAYQKQVIPITTTNPG